MGGEKEREKTQEHVFKTNVKIQISVKEIRHLIKNYLQLANYLRVNSYLTKHLKHLYGLNVKCKCKVTFIIGGKNSKNLSKGMFHIPSF